MNNRSSESPDTENRPDIVATLNRRRPPVDKLLGITYTHASPDKIIGEMLIKMDIHTQPMGVLHGGISVVLAESVGSVASNLRNMLQSNPDLSTAFVGLDINANHIKSGVVGDTVIAWQRPYILGNLPKSGISTYHPNNMVTPSAWLV